MAPSQLERIESLEFAVGDLIPREELTKKLDAAADAAGAARDVTTRLEVLLREKIVPMVEEDHRTLRGHNSDPGLVADVKNMKDGFALLRGLAIALVVPLVLAVGTFVWALLNHRLILEEVVVAASTAIPH